MIGDKIKASDYNGYQRRIAAILGSGGTNPNTDAADPKYGYGQAVQSSQVNTSRKVKASEWSQLIYDVVNVWKQQNGNSIAVPLSTVLARAVTTGKKIRANTIIVKNIVTSDICETDIDHDLRAGDIFVPSISSNNFVAGTVYYVRTVPSSVRFTVSTTPTGSTFNLVEQSGISISGTTSSQPYTYLNSVITSLDALPNRLIAANLKKEFIRTKGNTVSFKSTLNYQIDVEFATATKARWFFNSGGIIYFTSSLARANDKIQNQKWEDFISSASEAEPGLSATGSVNFYTLTNAFQTLYQVSNSSIPAYNERFIWRIRVSTPGINNSGGTARIIRFVITFIDNYVDPPITNTPFTNLTEADFPPTDGVEGVMTVSVGAKYSYYLFEPAGSGEFTLELPNTVTINDPSAS